MLQTDTSTLLPRLLTILVTLSGVALLCWQARQLYLQMTRLPVASAAETTRPPADPQRLQRLFGAAGNNTEARLPGVTLLGCIVAANPAQSQALLHIDGMGTLTVVSGDEFLPDTRVERIGSDHLMFSRGGASGRLEFDRRTPVMAPTVPVQP